MLSFSANVTAGIWEPSLARFATCPLFCNAALRLTCCTIYGTTCV
jgi:hypothetical protein